MTSIAEPPEDEAFWRRPVGGVAGPLDPPSAPTSPAPPYTGPPRPQLPPRGWKPPVVVQTPEPRNMPAQDLSRLNREERSASTWTNGVGMIAGAVMLILLMVLCGRWLF